MLEYNNLFELIYSYYPKNLEYSSENYQVSSEFQKLKEKICNDDLRFYLEEKILAIAKLIFANNFVKVWTNRENPCIHLSILLHENQHIMDDDEVLLKALNGKRLDLEIYISLLGDYFYAFIVETIKHPYNGSLKFSIMEEDTLVDKERINTFFNSLMSCGFFKLDKSTAHVIVPDIETELLYSGEVKVFNCLFTDLVNKF